jgi:hypothetical protein
MVFEALVGVRLDAFGTGHSAACLTHSGGCSARDYSLSNQ